MLSDAQLAEYLDGSMAPEEVFQFEVMAAEDDGMIAQIVAQQRIDQALQLLVAGANGEFGELKQSILQDALNIGLRDASGGALGKKPQESKAGLVWAVICLISVVLLAICLWWFAPRL